VACATPLGSDLVLKSLSEGQTGSGAVAASAKAQIALAVTPAVSAKGLSLSTLGPSSPKPHERSCIEIWTHASAGVSGGERQTGRGAVAASAKARIAPFVSAILHALLNLSEGF